MRPCVSSHGAGTACACARRWAPEIRDDLVGALLPQPPGPQHRRSPRIPRRSATARSWRRLAAGGCLRFVNTDDWSRAARGEARRVPATRIPPGHFRGLRGDHVPSRSALPCLRGRADLRSGTASARIAGSEGRRGRADPAQHRGIHSVPGLQPELWLSVEQSGRGPRGAGRRTRPAGWPRPRPSSTTGSGRRWSRGDHGALCRCHRPCAGVPGVGGRLLAVQASLSHAGRAAGGGARAQAARASALGHRGRFLPLDAAGRMEIRPRAAGPTRRRWCASWTRWASK